jgi:hypothetical protein
VGAAAGHWRGAFSIQAIPQGAQLLALFLAQPGALSFHGTALAFAAGATATGHGRGFHSPGLEELVVGGSAGLGRGARIVQAIPQGAQLLALFLVQAGTYVLHGTLIPIVPGSHSFATGTTATGHGRCLQSPGLEELVVGGAAGFGRGARTIQAIPQGAQLLTLFFA